MPGKTKFVIPAKVGSKGVPKGVGGNTRKPGGFMIPAKVGSKGIPPRGSSRGGGRPPLD